MNKRSYLEYLAMAALLVTFFGYFAVKVWDIDFWWHIAAGRNILESGAIPSTDPFGAYDAGNVWGQTILKSQWLGQVMLYSVFRRFDLDGIIYLRAGVLTLCLVIVYLRCCFAGTASLYGLGITALAGLAILQHTGERPQLFSFLYLSLIFLLLDVFIRNGKRWLLYFIPLLMLLWSNTHGGAVLGEVVLGLFGAGYIMENRLASGRINTPETGLMLLVVALSAVALVLAPNGFTTFKHIIALESNPIRDRTSEYASPVEIWRAALFYWVFAGVALVSLAGLFSRTQLKQGAVVVAMGIVSLTGYRYIPFFVLLAAPYVAASLERLLRRFKLHAVAVNLSVLIIALALLGYGFKQERVFQHGIVENKFPAGAVAFIKANKLGGKIFNTMNWGGYLIWNLSATTTVFADGRMLDPARIVPYTHILWTTSDGQRFFEQENFDLTLVPYGNVFTGEQYPLVAYLQSHPDWLNVYQDATGYLFVRRESGAH
jgi:hypothetical protein